MTASSRRNVPTILSILVLALTTPPVLAQNSSDTLCKYELGVDLLSPFRIIRLDELNSTYGLVIKRRVKRQNAIRLRTNLGYEYMPDPPLKGANQPRFYSLSFDLGYEIQRRTKRFTNYYGFDLILRHSRTNEVIGLGVAPSDPSFFNTKRKVNATGFAPFIGGKFHIANRVSISLETSCHLTYSKVEEYSQQLSSTGQITSTQTKTLDTNGVEFKINPISVLYLSYYF